MNKKKEHPSTGVKENMLSHIVISQVGKSLPKIAKCTLCVTRLIYPFNPQTIMLSKFTYLLMFISDVAEWSNV